MAVVGYLNMRLAWWERIWAFAAGVALILAMPISDEIGYLLGITLIAQHLWRARRVAVAAA
jgi:TRAP-type uncharacterized transport system fused permease subunit